MFETYFFLFIDSLFAALILPIRQEMVFEAMITFDNHYDIYLIFITAFFASVIGLTINFGLGKLLGLIKKSDFFKGSEDKLLKVQNFWNKFIIWFLPILVLFPFASVFCLFCGFFNSKLRYFIPLILLGRFIYYYFRIGF